MAKQKILPNQLIESAVKDKCLKSFKHFFSLAFPVVDTATLEWNWHISVICDHLQNMLFGWMGKDNTPQLWQNIAINVCPGSMKSLIVSVAFPAWCWLHDPSIKLLCFSANPEVALRDAGKNRLLIESDWYRNTFNPTWSMSEDQNAKGNFTNTAKGSRVSKSVSAKLTGERANILIFDDLHDVSEANSDVIREGVLTWYNETAQNRLNDLRKDLRISICQRVHEEDFTAHVLSQGWTLLSIPQEFEPEKKSKTPIWEDPRTLVGELMFPQRFTRKILNQQKQILTDFGYAAQHQQSPVSAAGNLFKKAWFRYYEENEDSYVLYTPAPRVISKKGMRKFTTCDFAFSEKETADYTVMATWHVSPEGDMLLVDLVREHLADPDIENKIDEVWATQRPEVICIENKVNGATMLQRLLRKPHIRVKPLKCEGDKVQRSLSLRVDMGNGKYFFKKHASYLPIIMDELLRFPAGKHDDFVDCASYSAIQRLNITMGDPTVALSFSVRDPSGIAGKIPQEDKTMDAFKKQEELKIAQDKEAAQKRLDRIYSDPRAWH